MNKKYSFYNCNSIDREQFNNLNINLKENGKMVFETGKKPPEDENIVLFRGIVSQAYKPGKKSRNNYKYDQNGWDFNDYKNNPIIAWQHNLDYGTIGHATNFYHDDEGNLCANFYVDLRNLEPRHANQVKNGFVTGISTGASTEEYKFEENDGNLLTEEEAVDKYGEDNVFYALMGWASDFITLVVTKAKLLENSLVTIGSNERAIATTNSVHNHKALITNFMNKYNISNNSLNMHNIETKEETQVEVQPETQPEVQSEAQLEAKVEENTEAEVLTTKDLPTKENNSQSAGERNSVTPDAEYISKNDFEAYQKTIEAKIDKAVENAINNFKENELDAFRNEERANLGKIVGNKNNVKSIEDFKNKYSNQ